jgi:hypothetical protein
MGQRIKKITGGLIDFFSGDIILRKGLDRKMWFFLYIFGLFCVIILWSLMVESRLVKVERNEQTIKELEVNLHQRTVELVGLNKRSRIENMLKASGSTLKAPKDPAIMIETK